MLLLMAGGIATAAMAARPIPARPLGVPGTWITPDDYPKSALLNGVAGTTGFVLLIGTDGKVNDCEIIESSGSDSLDAVACALLRERARFAPARDASGRPATSSYRSSVRWQIPEGDPIPLVAFSGSVEFNVDAAGVTSACRERDTLPDAAALNQLCSAIISRTSFEPARDASGVARAKHVTVRFDVGLSDPAPASPPAPARGLSPIARIDYPPPRP